MTGADPAVVFYYTDNLQSGGIHIRQQCRTVFYGTADRYDLTDAGEYGQPYNDSSLRYCGIHGWHTGSRAASRTAQ